jgi:hypothetical protein
MSKVKIQGNASGTGIFTVAAPATNADRTITLPDTSSTLLAPDSTGSIQLDFAGSNNYLRFISSANYVGRNSSTGDIWLNAQGGQSVILGINAATQLKVDGNGRVTTPNQPAFRATNNNSTQSLTANTETLVQYNAVETNISNSYNTSNYRFTAPVAGFYHFSASILVTKGSSTRIDIMFKKNGSYWVSAEAQALNSTSTNTYINNSMDGYLNANDYVDVWTRINDNGSIYAESKFWNFSGFLLG